MFFWKRKKKSQYIPEALNEEQLALLEKKFIIGADHKAEAFLREIIKWTEDHDKEATKHKHKYFKINTKVNRGISFTKSVKTWKDVILAMIPGISATVIVQVILNVFKDYFETNNNARIIISIASIICLIITTLLCIRMLFGIESSKKELELRQHGETWVRHRTSWWTLKQEMLWYLYDLGEYSQKTQLEKKQFFMERIILLENEDMEVFKKNMSGIK